MKHTATNSGHFGAYRATRLSLIVIVQERAVNKALVTHLKCEIDNNIK